VVKLAGRELVTQGLIRAEDIEDGTVARMPKAYPVYDSIYKEALTVVRAFLQPLQNLIWIGRNGVHKYNNQDHSMLTAMLALKNILGGKHNLWDVNVAQESCEEATNDKQNAQAGEYAATQPRVPERIEELSSL